MGLRGALAGLKLHEVESFKCLMVIFETISIFEHVVSLTLAHETTIHLLPELWHGILKLTCHFVTRNKLLLHVILININALRADGI